MTVSEYKNIKIENLYDISNDDYQTLYNNIETENIKFIGNHYIVELLGVIFNNNLLKYLKIRNIIYAKYGTHYWNGLLCGRVVMDEIIGKKVLYLIDYI
jgi:hypothetical protein